MVLVDAFPEKGVQQAVERRKTASIEPFELDFDNKYMRMMTDCKLCVGCVLLVLLLIL